MKTLTLPESEIITLADAAKKHGTVELAIAIGIGKSQLYRILRGHNRITPATADKINAWLRADVPQQEQPPKQEKPPKPEKRPSKSRNLATSQSRDLADRPAAPTRPTKSELIAALHNPEFLKIALEQLYKAVLGGSLNISITISGGSCTCGD